MKNRFEFKDFPKLETERFILRKGTVDDCSDLFELYANENVVKYLPLNLFESVEDAMVEINWYEKIFKEQIGLRWVIEEAKTKKVIGTCGYLNYEKEHNRIEIGYDLKPDYWGHGIMQETLGKIIHFAFTSMEINKIEAKVEPENKASIRLLGKLNFCQEGILRQHEFEKGKYVDLVLFSILKSEYIELNEESRL
ncbi:GNAT family N-acetyltransferase [Lysinibacillus fusiformis]|uniref:GNAT family N-acetyltransferase n=1 Tax=Lysinibacillus fusiformis TaxID=28031 RepID=UPI00215AEBCA|nr:GNAT family protein [Lysinibacillus fusiformis]MCR8853623.1 GNAT family N-acetyltransferase [Lysinibacillus fusiformis]WKT79545.1 GNAT family protein [Lysinibacillus fusiformis]